MGEDLPDWRQFGDQGDQSIVAAAPRARRWKRLSPILAISFAQAIHEVSCGWGLSEVAPFPRPSPGRRGKEDVASRCLPTFPIAIAVTAGRGEWFGAQTQ